MDMPQLDQKWELIQIAKYNSYDSKHILMEKGQ